MLLNALCALIVPMLALTPLAWPHSAFQTTVVLVASALAAFGCVGSLVRPRYQFALAAAGALLVMSAYGLSDQTAVAALHDLSGLTLFMAGVAPRTVTRRFMTTGVSAPEIAAPEAVATWPERRAA